MPEEYCTALHGKCQFGMKKGWRSSLLGVVGAHSLLYHADSKLLRWSEFRHHNFEPFPILAVVFNYELKPQAIEDCHPPAPRAKRNIGCCVPGNFGRIVLRIPEIASVNQYFDLAISELIDLWIETRCEADAGCATAGATFDGRRNRFAELEKNQRIELGVVTISNGVRLRDFIKAADAAYLPSLGPEIAGFIPIRVHGKPRILGHHRQDPAHVLPSYLAQQVQVQVHDRDHLADRELAGAAAVGEQLIVVRDDLAVHGEV